MKGTTHIPRLHEKIQIYVNIVGQRRAVNFGYLPVRIEKEQSKKQENG